MHLTIFPLSKLKDSRFNRSFSTVPAVRPSTTLPRIVNFRTQPQSGLGVGATPPWSRPRTTPSPEFGGSVRSQLGFAAASTHGSPHAPAPPLPIPRRRGPNDLFMLGEAAQPLSPRAQQNLRFREIFSELSAAALPRASLTSPLLHSGMGLV